MNCILIDVSRLVQRLLNKRLPTGVDRVGLAYVRHYLPQARAVLRSRQGKFVFRQKESIELFNWILALGESGSPMGIIYKGLVTGCLAQKVNGAFLFNTGHSGLESQEYVEMILRQKVRPIFMIHDLIPISHPQFCREGERERHIERLRNAMRMASAIVCNSQATMDRLALLCSDRKWSMPASTVALLAPDLPDAKNHRRPIDQPYFVFVSTIEPRKNHAMILRVWKSLAEKLGDAAPRLVIIGQRGWDYESVIESLEGSPALLRLVTELPICTDLQMVNYFQHAQALVFPSFVEGYGMPVIEALAHGLPVIASDLPVFREFAGNVPHYLNVDDQCGWTQAIIDYSSQNSSLRYEQLERMKGLRAPTWSDHFERVDALVTSLG